MNSSKVEALMAELKAKASSEHCTAAELDLLVSRARTLAKQRAEELEKLHQLLEQVEAKLTKG